MPTTHVGPGSAQELQTIADTMARARKVVVITGAGISTNCGIPDFRSEDGLYSLIQAQYDAALQNPPWQSAETFELDDRPKKKRKTWFYEVVASDGEVVGVIDDEHTSQETKADSRESSPLSSVSRNSRSTSPTANSTIASSVSGDQFVTLGSLEDIPAAQSNSVCPRSSRETTPTNQEPPTRSSTTRTRSNSPLRISASGNKSEQTLDSTVSSRPSSRAKSSRRKSPANILSTSGSAPKQLPPTRTRTLRTQGSSTLSSSEDENQLGAQLSLSSQTSRTSLPNLKGRDLFDSMVWSDAFTTSIFYMFISSLREKIQNEVKYTTESHKFIKALRDGGRLVRNYTQNIDSLEAREGLSTDLTLGPGNRARFNPKTQREVRPDNIDSDSAHSGGVECVLLHGSLVSLRCGICAKLSSWDEGGRVSATLSGQAPDCPSCTEYNAKRTGNGRRGLAVGRLRPDIVLYGEEHPHANLVSPIVTHDLGLGPDVLLIMGTSLKVHGLKILVKEFSKAVHNRGGKVVFVNNTKPSESTWGDVIDYWVQWDCDAWVLDLKERRGELWLPQGTVFEKPRESLPDAKPQSRPWCTRDDKLNGVFVTFKILDSLRDATDGGGAIGDRHQYWKRPPRVSNVAEKPLPEIRPAAKKPPRKSEPVKKLTTTISVPKRANVSRKRKSEPACLRDDKYNAAEFTLRIWESLRRYHPRLSESAPEISLPLLQERCRNIPTTEQRFAFNGESNHFSYVPWGLENMNLVTHPPSGAMIPIHTPHINRVRSSAYRHSARLSSKAPIEDTIIVDAHLECNDNKDTIVVESEMNKENRFPTPPSTDPMTPSSCRIKSMGSIGAILSSPEESSNDEWHDASEVLT